MEEYYKNIESWLNKELSAEEQQAFETAMAKDAALAKEVKTQILERETAALFFEMELKEDLATWKEQKKNKAINLSSNPSPKKATKLRVLRRSWAIAAGFLMLFSLGMLWWFNQQPTHKIILAEQYLPADLPGDRSQTTNILSPTFEEGLDAFAEDNYSLSIQKLVTIVTADSNYVSAQYYLGHAYFQEKQYQPAMTAFQKVLTQTTLPGYIDRNKLKWNLLLAYVGSEKEVASMEVLWDDLIENGPSPYNRMAKELRTKNAK